MRDTEKYLYFQGLMVVAIHDFDFGTFIERLTGLYNPYSWAPSTQSTVTSLSILHIIGLGFSIFHPGLELSRIKGSIWPLSLISSSFRRWLGILPGFCRLARPDLLYLSI